MPRVSAKVKTQTKTRQAILQTLAFFSLYNIPVRKENLYRLMYKHSASYVEFDAELAELLNHRQVYGSGDWVAIKPWDEQQFRDNLTEIEKRWRKVNRYFWLLSILPFVEQLSVINSLVLGNADQESDIDFFVITKPNRLYFVRSLIIIVFRTLGLYKTRQVSVDRFCFGFYITSDKLDLSSVLLEGGDPLFAFWFAHFAPLLGDRHYERFVSSNLWIREYFPDFTARERREYLKPVSSWQRVVKFVLELLLFLPASFSEPVLRQIHIRHTFKLPENHWPTATTVADRHMLKLHALDPRKQVRESFLKALQNLS